MKIFLRCKDTTYFRIWQVFISEFGAILLPNLAFSCKPICQRTLLLPTLFRIFGKLRLFLDATYRLSIFSIIVGTARIVTAEEHIVSISIFEISTAPVGACSVLIGKNTIV